MLDKILQSPLFDEVVLSKLAELHKFIIAEDIWQCRLLNSSSFDSKLQEYGIGRLWDRLHLFSRYSLVKSDCIFLNLNKQFDYLLSIKRYYGDEVYLFIDIEDTSEIDLTHLYLLDENNEQQTDYQLYFHLYRVYGVNRLFNLTKRSIARYQPFLDIGGLRRINRRDEEEIESYLKNGDIWKHVQFYNILINLCIVSEVAFYSSIFHKTSYVAHSIPHQVISKIPYISHLPDQVTRIDEIIQLRDELRASLQDIYQVIGLDTIKLLRTWLVREAEQEDPNKTIHALLRMMKSEERLRLEGKLGLSMLLLEMAEFLRRAAEFYFGIELDEENKVNNRWYFNNFMKDQFGTVRILDDPIAKTEFIRFLGLDYTLRAKIYVEGATEYGFLEKIFHGIHAIQIINLKGQFVERNGKGIAFRESLREDQRLHLFSFVFLDADRQDNIRVLKQAVLEGDFFGMFLISDPDFECGNFSLTELYTAFCNYHHFKKDPEFSAESERIKSGKEFFSIVKKLHPQEFNKSVEWGKALCQFAYQSEQNDRQLLQFIRKIMVSLRCGYEWHKRKFNVDPNSGELIENK